MKTYTTPKGTALPLTNLKGKDYLQVAYRLQWFVEENKSYTVNTEFLVLTDDQTVARATIAILDENGKVTRQAVATKRETKKDFSDHTEKAETGALGRALIELGYGTQYALSDMDEGARIVDSPLVDPKAATPVAAAQTPKASEQAATIAPMKTSSFSKKKSVPAAVVAATETKPTATAQGDDGWN